QMVAGLSHHLNNPLAAILGYSELLLRRDLDASAKGMLELIHQEAERCKHTLQSLNEMTRRPAQGFQTVDLPCLVQECVAMKTNEFEAHQVHVQLDFPAAGLVSRANPIALQQVVFHLFDNALQALDGQSEERTISISGLNANGWTVVRVKDNGSGIRPDVLPRIFEPFYTTKPKEQSSGLGLTVCLAILQEHEGRIEVESTEEHGTCVTLFLPDKAKPAAASSNISKVLAGRQILVAEDEPALAQLLTSLLTPLKADVVHVSDGLEALASAQQGHWDLIISDIQMSGMNGIELYHRLASINPLLADRMILITGSTRAQPETLLPNTKVKFLYKPFSRSELMDAISRTLAEPPRGDQST
ncbi:MAG: hybrid sensor histidine kinase/response regulator, partial [Terriglobia bacterium]